MRFEGGYVRVDIVSVRRRTRAVERWNGQHLAVHRFDGYCNAIDEGTGIAVKGLTERIDQDIGVYDERTVKQRSVRNRQINHLAVGKGHSNVIFIRVQSLEVVAPLIVHSSRTDDIAQRINQFDGQTGIAAPTLLAACFDLSGNTVFRGRSRTVKVHHDRLKNAVKNRLAVTDFCNRRLQLVGTGRNLRNNKHTALIHRDRIGHGLTGNRCPEQGDLDGQVRITCFNLYPTDLVPNADCHGARQHLEDYGVRIGSSEGREHLGDVRL